MLGRSPGHARHGLHHWALASPWHITLNVWNSKTKHFIHLKEAKKENSSPTQEQRQNPKSDFLESGRERNVGSSIIHTGNGKTSAQRSDTWQHPSNAKEKSRLSRQMKTRNHCLGSHLNVVTAVRRKTAWVWSSVSRRCLRRKRLKLKAAGFYTGCQRQRLVPHFRADCSKWQTGYKWQGQEPEILCHFSVPEQLLSCTEL